MTDINEMAQRLHDLGESPSSIKYLILKATENDEQPISTKPIPLPYTTPAIDTGD